MKKVVVVILLLVIIGFFYLSQQTSVGTSAKPSVEPYICTQDPTLERDNLKVLSRVPNDLREQLTSLPYCVDIVYGSTDGPPAQTEFINDHYRITFDRGQSQNQKEAAVEGLLLHELIHTKQFSYNNDCIQDELEAYKWQDWYFETYYPNEYIPFNYTAEKLSKVPAYASCANSSATSAQ